MTVTKDATKRKLHFKQKSSNLSSMKQIEYEMTEHLYVK